MCADPEIATHFKYLHFLVLGFGVFHRSTLSFRNYIFKFESNIRKTFTGVCIIIIIIV